MTTSTEPCIEFLCAPQDLGVIAPPVPAREALPDWFRRLAPVDKNHLSTTDNALTVKRCMPFLDALMAGWILPLAATVRIEIADKGETVNTGWDFDKTMVSNHHPYQVNGHPMQPRPPCKIHNHWTIRTPPGWSCLFIPPMTEAEATERQRILRATGAGDGWYRKEARDRRS